MNTLTRKLEKLRAEKAELENVLEAESESLVLRLQRQLSQLMQQQNQQQQPASIPSASAASNSLISPTSPSAGATALLTNSDPLNPSPATLIEILKTENATLRNRLVNTEREFIKTTRQSEMYRSELIALRQRAGIPIDDLIGAAPTVEDNYPSALAARRRSRGGSTSANGIPIPGLPGDVRRRPHHAPSFSSSSMQLGGSSFTPSTPMTPSSLPGDSANPISISLGTTLTTPSTSYPGLPVPHSTPAVSPANGRHHDHGLNSNLNNRVPGNSLESSHPVVTSNNTRRQVSQADSETARGHALRVSLSIPSPIRPYGRGDVHTPSPGGDGDGVGSIPSPTLSVLAHIDHEAGSDKHGN